MKFTVEGKAFQQQLQAVSKVVNAKNALNILDNFLLKIEGETLSITGSDQENALTARMIVTDTEGDGIVAIPARRLLEVTKEVSNQPVTVTVDENNKIVLEFLNGYFEFMGVPGEDYPLPRKLEGDVSEMVLPASVVMKGINNTMFAASTDTVRPVMMGIHWDIHENDITFVSSDTHKLARYINRECAPGQNMAFTMAPKASAILNALVTKDMAEIKLVSDSKGCVLEFGDYTMTSMFINGQYPNYNRVIPQSQPFALTVDRVSLLSSLRRVTLFASKASNLVVISLEPNQLTVKAQDVDYGQSAEERVNCDYDGNPMTIGFNGVFMIQILGNLKGDAVQLHLSDPARPGVYEPMPQQEGEDMLVIQMPMQVL